MFCLKKTEFKLKEDGNGQFKNHEAHDQWAPWQIGSKWIGSGADLL